MNITTFCPEKLPTVQYNVLPVLCIHIYVMALEAVKNTGLSSTGSTWIQLVCVRKSTRLETLHIPHFCCIKRSKRKTLLECNDTREKTYWTRQSDCKTCSNSCDFLYISSLLLLSSWSNLASQFRNCGSK